MSEVEGLVVDRSRITHGEFVAATLFAVRAQQALKALELEKVEELLRQADETLAKMVIGVPEGWLPEGVTLDTPGWINLISQERYELIQRASAPAAPGEKKA